MPRRHSPKKPSRYQPPIQAKNCRDKRRFPTEKQARDAADVQMLTDMKLELDVYRCPYCYQWHLTSHRAQS